MSNEVMKNFCIIAETLISFRQSTHTVSYTDLWLQSFGPMVRTIKHKNVSSHRMLSTDMVPSKGLVQCRAFLPEVLLLKSFGTGDAVGETCK